MQISSKHISSKKGCWFSMTVQNVHILGVNSFFKVTKRLKKRAYLKMCLTVVLLLLKKWLNPPPSIPPPPPTPKLFRPLFCFVVLVCCCCWKVTILFYSLFALQSSATAREACKGHKPDGLIMCCSLSKQLQTTADVATTWAADCRWLRV